MVIFMNILGIIAEFNPLHTGHEYLIRHLRRGTGADFCVVVMSGDYVQRGEPAFFSKFLRTKAALLSGADLVLELPLSVSTGSAEYFAEGAVSLLNRLGCVTHLGFGSESGDIHTFLSAGKLLSEVPACYDELLQKNLRAGMNFPKARYEALSACLKMQGSQENSICGQSIPDRNTADQKESVSENLIFSPENISKLLSLLNAPNNILGAEYCKALYKLGSSMIPVTVKRLGAGYHEEVKDSPASVSSHDFAFGLSESLYASASDSELSGSPQGYASDSELPGFPQGYASDSELPGSPQRYASASGLRKAFLHAQNASSGDTADVSSLLENYISIPCRSLYAEALQSKQYAVFDQFFLPLYHILQYSDAETLARCQDVTKEFAERLKNLYLPCSSVTELCDALKSKNMTAATIRRCLLHILLHVTKETVTAEKEQSLSLYARILGFRREAEPLLSEIARRTSIPLVSKPADASKNLSPLALSQLKQTIKASELYRAAMPGSNPGSEYVQRIVLI